MRSLDAIERPSPGSERPVSGADMSAQRSAKPWPERPVNLYWIEIGNKSGK